MMEAMPAMMGPVMIGPGVASDNGHGYHAGRQLFGMMKTLEKTGNVSAVARSAAADLVTLDQEFFKMETVIPYRYHVRSDGKWVNEGRTLEEISGSGAGEGRVQRVIEVQDRMIQDKSITQAVVASEDFGSGRNYLYLFQKKGDKISAYAIEYQGTQGEFRNLLGRLMDKTEGKAQNQKINFATPIFFKQKSQIQVQDVFAAALHSYENPQRKLEMQPFLARLARDTDDLPNLIKRQKTRIEEYTQRFKDEMLSQPDVIAGLSAGAHAVTTIAEQWIAKGRELYVERLGDIGRRSVYETSVIIQPVFQHGESISSFSSIVYASTPTQPVSSPDTSLSSVSKQENKHTEDDSPQTTNTSIETHTHYIEETLEPIVPGLIIIISLLSHGEVPSDISVSQPFLVPEDSFTLDRILFSESDQSSERVTDDRVWQNFLMLLFSPEAQDSTREEVGLFFPDVAPAGEGPDLIGVGRQEQVYEATQGTFAELSIVLGDTEGSGEHIPQEIETEIVDMAKDILTFLFSEKNPLEGEKKEKNSKSSESEMYLSLFLSLYTDKKTTPEMKELLALFLYQEMELIGKEHISLSENIPYLTFMKEMSLYKKPLLEKRKALVSEKLWQLLSIEIHNGTYRLVHPNGSYLTLESRKRVETLLFLLYVLHKNEEEKLSLLVEAIEQLKQSASGEVREDNVDGYLFQLERLLISKQKKKRESKKTGIIYWFWQNEYYRLISLPLPVVNGAEM